MGIHPFGLVDSRVGNRGGRCWSHGRVVGRQTSRSVLRRDQPLL